MDNFQSALVAPVLRCVEVDLEIKADSHVSCTDGKPVPSVIAADDVPGGVHDANGLDSSSLLGRVSGASCKCYMARQHRQAAALSRPTRSKRRSDGRA